MGRTMYAKYPILLLGQHLRESHVAGADALLGKLSECILTQIISGVEPVTEASPPTPSLELKTGYFWESCVDLINL